MNNRNHEETEEDATITINLNPISYLKNHPLIFGVPLTTFGAITLLEAILRLSLKFDQPPYFVLPLSVLSVFSLIIGIPLLYIARVNFVNDKLIIGTSLIAFGVTYIVSLWMYGWGEGTYWYEGQKEFVRHYGFLAMPLFVLSLLSLIIGAILLYIESRRCPEKIQ
jgi:hypothetical protein